MQLIDFKELVTARQSCRSFSDKKVQPELLKRIMETAVLAPSACNSQPWKAYCVTDETKVKRVAEAVQDGGVNSFASEAPAFIVVSEFDFAQLKPGAKEKFGEDHFIKYNIGEFVAYITLAAKAAGLDTCIIGWINAEKLAAAAELPREETCNVVIAVGYGDCPLRKKTRKNFDETVKFI